MDFFTVSLFGHREIKDLRRLENKLAPIIKDLMRTKPYASFLIGRNGEFDEYAASVIKLAQREVRISTLLRFALRFIAGRPMPTTTVFILVTV